MLSYKKWKKLNESLLGAPLTLGIKSPASVQAAEGLSYMGGGGDDMNGDMAAMFGKPKKRRPKPPMGDMGDEEFGDEEEIIDDEELEDDELGDEEFGDEEEDEEFGDEEFGDEEEEEEEEFPRKKPMMGKPPFGEAKCPEVEDEEEEVVVDDDDDDDEVEDEEEEEEIQFQKKRMNKASYQKKNGKKKKMGGGAMPHTKLQKKNQKKNQKKQMTKEEVEFLSSLQKQTGATKFAIGESGFWMPVVEDALIAPSDPNAGVVEPQPGEVGYAPQGRIG